MKNKKHNNEMLEIDDNLPKTTPTMGGGITPIATPADHNNNNNNNNSSDQIKQSQEQDVGSRRNSFSRASFDDDSDDCLILEDEESDKMQPNITVIVTENDNKTNKDNNDNNDNNNNDNNHNENQNESKECHNDNDNELMNDTCNMFIPMKTRQTDRDENVANVFEKTDQSDHNDDISKDNENDNDNDNKNKNKNKNENTKINQMVQVHSDSINEENVTLLKQIDDKPNIVAETSLYANFKFSIVLTFWVS